MPAPTFGFQMQSDGTWIGWANSDNIADSPRFQGGDLNQVMEQVKAYVYDWEMQAKVKFELGQLAHECLQNFKKANPNYQKFNVLELYVEVVGIPYGIGDFERVKSSKKIHIPKAKK